MRIEIPGWPKLRIGDVDYRRLPGTFDGWIPGVPDGRDDRELSMADFEDLEPLAGLGPPGLPPWRIVGFLHDADHGRPRMLMVHMP